MFFAWYTDGDTPSQVFDGFRLSEPSARVFDAIAARFGATVAGRSTYEHSSHWGNGGPHPTATLGGLVAEALSAGLVDELILHQVPILLGDGRPFFQSLPEHVRPGGASCRSPGNSRSGPNPAGGP